MRGLLSVVLLAGLLLLDPRGADPAVCKLLILVPGFGLLLLISAGRPREIRLHPLDGAFLLTTLWILLSSSQAAYPGRFPEAALTLVVACGAYWLARRELGREDLEVPLGVLSLLAASSMLLELVIRPPWIANMVRGMAAEELVGCLANPNLTASCVLLGAAAATRRWGWPAALTCLGALVGSLSRGALLGGLVLVGLWGRSRGLSLAGRGKLLSGLVVLAVVLGLGVSQGVMEPAQLGRTRTVKGRLALYQIFARAGWSQRKTGWGVGRAGVAYSRDTALHGTPATLSDRVEFAHNPFLQRFVEGGIPGLLLFLLASLLSLRVILRRLRAPSPELAMGLTAFLMAEQVGVGLENAFLHCLVALLLGTLVSQTTREGARTSERHDPGIRSPLAALLAGLLLVATPIAVHLTQAERLRREIRAQTSRGEARPMEDEIADRHPSPELRYDAAGVLALERKLALARARYLVLESGYPNYGSARENRLSIREYQGK
jgi:O-antigen ligase